VCVCVCVCVWCVCVFVCVWCVCVCGDFAWRYVDYSCVNINGVYVCVQACLYEHKLSFGWISKHIYLYMHICTGKTISRYPCIFLCAYMDSRIIYFMCVIKNAGKLNAYKALLIWLT